MNEIMFASESSKRKQLEDRLHAGVPYESRSLIQPPWFYPAHPTTPASSPHNMAAMNMLAMPARAICETCRVAPALVGSGADSVGSDPLEVGDPVDEESESDDEVGMVMELLREPVPVGW